MTSYLILRKTKDDSYDTWEEIEGVVKASSSKRALAIAQVAAGEYVAVPYRSWKPLIVKVEQTTKVTIG